MAAGNENDIGGKVSLDITDFKANISELNRQIKIIDTGFKAAAAGMDDWGSNAEGLQARIKALNSITDLQRQKVEALTNEYKKVVSEKGEDSKAAQNLQIRINKETESLNKNQKELSDCTAKLNSLGNEMDQESSKANKFDGVLSKLGSRLGKIGATVGKAAVAGIAAVGAAASTAAVGAFKLAEQASTLSEAQNVVQQTFKKSSQDIINWSKTISQASGISQANATAFVGSMGAMLKSSGISEKAAADMSKALVQLTGDMSSFYNVSNEEMWEKIRSGISGETEPLKELGINMSVANLQAYALSQGIKKSYNEMSQAEQTTLRYNYLMSVTKDAQGDFGRTLATSFPNQLRVAQMQLETTATSIGQKLLPAFLGIFQAVNKGFSTGNWSQVGESITNGLKSAIGQLTSLVPAAANIATSLIFGLANAIVTAIPTILPPLINATMQLLNSLIQVISSSGPQLIQAAVQAITMLVAGISQALPNLIQAAVGIVMALINGITQALPQLVPVALQIVLALVNGIIPALPKLIEAALQMIMALVQGLTQALPQLIAAIPQIISSFANAIISNLPQIIDMGTQILEALVNGIINTIPALIAAIPKIIDALLNTILLNLPAIIESGIQLLQAIIDGLSQAIPQLISYIPTIVTTIVSVLIQNSPLLIEAALQIMIALALGMVQNIPQILAAIPKIVAAIIEGFAKVNWKEIGIDLIHGIVEGVKEAAASLAEGVVQAARNALNAAKRALGIHSPSTLFRDEVGLQIGAGMAEGIADSSKMINNAMNGLNKQLVADGNINVNRTINTTIKDNAIKNMQDNMQNTNTIMLNISMYMDSKIIAQAITPLSDLIQGKNLKLAARGAGL